jgi:hypothetical protein
MLLLAAKFGCCLLQVIDDGDPFDRCLSQNTKQNTVFQLYFHIMKLLSLLQNAIAGR